MFLQFYDQNSLHVHIVGASVRDMQCKMNLLGLPFYEAG